MAGSLTLTSKGQGHHLTFALTLTFLAFASCKGAYCPGTSWPNNSIRIGFISPLYGDYAYYSSAAAFTEAIDKAQKDGYLPDKNVT